MLRERGRIHTIDFLLVKVPDEKAALLSGMDAQALNYLKVYADETANATEEEILHNPQPAPPLGKLTKDDVLKCYSNVFRPGRGIPLGTPMQIELDPNVRPVHAQVRRVPVAKLDRVNEELQRRSNEGIIKPVTQPTNWLLNIPVKEKPNGKLRICIDPSQTINRAIRRPKYAIPTIEEKLPLLTNAKVFTIVDVSEAFHTVELDEESSLLTMFQGPSGRYCYTRMPFGIASGPEEYQRRKHEFLDGLQGVINIADDICVFGCGNSKEEADLDHEKNLTSLLEKCSKQNLRLSAKKLQFKSASVTFMGHKLTDKGMEPDPAKVDAITKMPTPTDKAAVQRFLGMWQYLSKFCHNLSETVKQTNKQETGKDSVLASLCDVVASGWPAERKETPEHLRQYWSFRDEISVYDGVVYRSHQVIVPSSLREEMLQKIHKAHQRVDSCIRRAHESLFWSGMQAAIKDSDYIELDSLSGNTSVWCTVEVKPPYIKTQL